MKHHRKTKKTIRRKPTRKYRKSSRATPQKTNRVHRDLI